jgi:acetyl esterase/lipase
MRPVLILLGPILAACLCAGEKPQAPAQPASGPGGSDYKHAAVRQAKYGQGGTEFHLFEPAEPVPVEAPVIVFLHGWTAIDPWLYGAWIEHLTKRGNIVIHCRYQESALTPPVVFTSNCVAAVKAALEELSTPGHVKPDTRRFAIAGHSVGGLLTVNLAAVCAEHGLPDPRALLSVQPGRSVQTGRGFGVPMENLAMLPQNALLLCVTGERDNVCGDTDAKRILAESTAIPAERKNLVVLTEDRHGHPALTASHLAPNSIPADPQDTPAAGTGLERPSPDVLLAAATGDFAPARAFLSTPEGRQWRRLELSRLRISEVFDAPNAQDFALWKMFDRLCDAAFTGKVTVDAMMMSPRSLHMGKWSDGTEIKPMRSGHR